MYLYAVLDWASRPVLAWRVSNTLTTDFFLEAVQDALANYGTSEICEGVRQRRGRQPSGQRAVQRQPTTLRENPSRIQVMSATQS